MLEIVFGIRLKFEYALICEEIAYSSTFMCVFIILKKQQFQGKWEVIFNAIKWSVLEKKYKGIIEKESKDEWSLEEKFYK